MRTLTLALFLFTPLAPAAEPEPDRKPMRFAIVYNRGYAGDYLPADEEEFEKLVKAVKAAHFNVILGQYEPWRAAVCKKHEVQLFVDLLAPAHHVYKTPEETKKLLVGLRGDPVIYGYHLWSDNITDATVPGRTRDVKNVHEWDPTHPAYVGTTNMNRVNRVEGYDLFGYYDFHWKRGGHWQHLTKAFATAEGRKLGFLRYDDPAAGLVGKGNPNRVGYTFATSVPFGLKGIIYHHSGDAVDQKTFTLTPLGDDLKKVNERFITVGDEVMKIGVPSAVYSTPVTKTAKNDSVEEQVPEGLTVVPADHWFRITAGEVLVGQFADAEKRDVLVFACHNPYESQRVKLVAEAKEFEVFNGVSGKWARLRPNGNTVAFEVRDFGVTLVRITR